MTTTDRSGSAPVTLTNEQLAKLRTWLLDRVNAELRADTGAPGKTLREQVAGHLQEAYAAAQVRLTPHVREALLQEILNELTGFGPIQPLLDDATVSEVMVNGPQAVFAERKGRIELTEVRFEDDAHVLRIIDRIVSPLGRRVDSDSPLVDARLPDGSRVNAVVPPIAIDGPSITIRKFGDKKLTIDDLIAFGSLTAEMAEFLRACVVARLNVVVSGGTGAGKTTLLNVLSNFIPDHDRVVTIEDSAELKLVQPNLVRLEARPPNVEGKNAVTIRDLVKNALRMRPERIVIGEVRGGEALDMLQAMNTGHDGSLTTLHANTPRDAISRLETMALMSGLDLPQQVVREQIAAAVDLIVQQARLTDGSRRVTAVTEVAGMEGNVVTLSDIFKFREEGRSAEGKVIGEMRPTGIRPLFGDRLKAAGFDLRPEIFGARPSDILDSRRRGR